MANSKTQISELYVVLFNRASEGEGNLYWQNNTATVEGAATVMLATTAAKDYFGSSIDSNIDFIKTIYSNTFNKDYTQDKEGIDYWTALLDADHTRGEIVSHIVKAARDPKNAGDAQDQFTNRVEVSDYTADNVSQVPSDWATALNFAKDLNVTHTSDSLKHAKEAVDVISSNATPETFMATKDINSNVITFSGTATSDIYISWSSYVGDSVATFSRGGVTADNTYDFSTSDLSINIQTGQTLTSTASSLVGVTINGDGSVKISDVVSTTVNATDLSTIGGAVSGVVTVANAIIITGNTAQLNAALVTANTAVTANGAKVIVSDIISIPEINLISAKTSGTITATLTTGNLASFAALNETGNIYTITLNDTNSSTVSATDLSTLGGKTAGAVTVTNAVVISGTVSEVTAALITTDTLVAAPTAAVTIIDEAATEISATNLTTLSAKTTGVVTVENAVVISGTVSEITAVLVTEDTLVVAELAEINISGTATVVELNAIAAKTSGVVRAKITSDELVNYAALTEAGNLYTIIVTDTTAVASSLITLDGKTSVNVETAEDVDEITGNHADISTVINSTTIVTATDVNATVSDTMTAAQEAAMDGITTGIITATISDGTMANLANLLNINNNNILTVTVTDTTAAAADLITIDNKTPVNVETAAALNEITGNHADISTVINSTTIVTATDVNATVSDTMTAAQLITMDSITTGMITTTISDGTMANLATLTDTNGNNALTIVLTDTGATATELNTLNGKTSVNINAAAISGIQSSALADVKTMINNKTAIGIDDNWTAILADTTVSIADANTVDAATAGAVTARIVTESATNLATLTGTNNAYTITTSGTSASAIELNTINLATSVNVNAGSITTITSSAVADVKTLITNRTAAGIDGDWTVTLSDTAISTEDLNTVNAGTTGTVTATAATTISGGATAFNTLSTAIDAAEVIITGNEAFNVTDTTSIAIANKLDARTSGVVTATITETNIVTLTTLTGTNNAYTITTSSTSASAVNINTIDAATSVNMNATSVTAITSSNVTDVMAMGSAKATNGLDDDWDVVLANSITAVLADQLDGYTTGDIDYNGISSNAHTNAIITSLNTGDVITTGLTFDTHTSEVLADEAALLEWNLTGTTLTYETVVDSVSNGGIVTLELTGLASITESDGNFTVTMS